MRSTLPRPATIGTRRVASIPLPGSIPSPRVVGYRRPASIAVERPYTSLPLPGTVHLTDTPHGDTPGKVTVADRVVLKVARRAAGEHPDVGGAGTRLLGAKVPGIERIGGASAGLDSLPGAQAEVDGGTTWIELDMSVRYPAPLVETTAAVRELVQQRVGTITGLEVAEVDITVSALVTDLPSRPRVR
jgi:uncharacterized alkaline shock family protein YloU